ncbi:hypothetical protein M5K25_012220 [Dendrobium thyrsiflorum]|uniref:Uncharacterized protein n=1 Tax=Dendrobium thyrsiflorum TaxID=117978 RepID=A0ABD0V470_DENTH
MARSRSKWGVICDRSKRRPNGGSAIKTRGRPIGWGSNPDVTKRWVVSTTVMSTKIWDSNSRKFWTATVVSEDVGQQEGDSGFAGQQSPSVRRAGTAKVQVGNFWTARTLAGIFWIAQSGLGFPGQQKNSSNGSSGQQRGRWAEVVGPRGRTGGGEAGRSASDCSRRPVQPAAGLGGELLDISKPDQTTVDPPSSSNTDNFSYQNHLLPKPQFTTSPSPTLPIPKYRCCCHHPPTHPASKTNLRSEATKQPSQFPSFFFLHNASAQCTRAPRCYVPERPSAEQQRAKRRRGLDAKPQWIKAKREIQIVSRKIQLARLIQTLTTAVTLGDGIEGDDIKDSRSGGRTMMPTKVCDGQRKRKRKRTTASATSATDNDEGLTKLCCPSVTTDNVCNGRRRHLRRTTKASTTSATDDDTGKVVERWRIWLDLPLGELAFSPSSRARAQLLISTRNASSDEALSHSDPLLQEQNKRKSNLAFISIATSSNAPTPPLSRAPAQFGRATFGRSLEQSSHTGAAIKLKVLSVNEPLIPTVQQPKRHQTAMEQQPENRERGHGSSRERENRRAQKTGPQKAAQNPRPPPSKAANQGIKRGNPRGIRTGNRNIKRNTKRPNDHPKKVVHETILEPKSDVILIPIVDTNIPFVTNFIKMMIKRLLISVMPILPDQSSNSSAFTHTSTITDKKTGSCTILEAQEAAQLTRKMFLQQGQAWLPEPDEPQSKSWGTPGIEEVPTDEKYWCSLVRSTARSTPHCGQLKRVRPWGTLRMALQRAQGSWILVGSMPCAGGVCRRVAPPVNMSSGGSICGNWHLGQLNSVIPGATVRISWQRAHRTWQLPGSGGATDGAAGTEGWPISSLCPVHPFSFPQKPLRLRLCLSLLRRIRDRETVRSERLYGSADLKRRRRFEVK